MATGSGLIALAPLSWGAVGYVGPLLIVTPGYALFQAANNTAVMAGATAAQRGLVAGVLALSRNLGFITCASAMPALFAWGGLPLGLGGAAGLVGLALVLALRTENANHSC